MKMRCLFPSDLPLLGENPNRLWYNFCIYLGMFGIAFCLGQLWVLSPVSFGENQISHHTTKSLILSNQTGEDT